MSSKRPLCAHVIDHYIPEFPDTYDDLILSFSIIRQGNPLIFLSFSPLQSEYATLLQTKLHAYIITDPTECVDLGVQLISIAPPE